MDYTVCFDAPVERVYADFTDRTYWDTLMAAYGWFTPHSEVTHFTSDDSGTDIVFTQTLPRTELPPIARSVMPVDMVITRAQHFDPFDADARRATGGYRATVPRGPGHLTGRYFLESGPDGTQMRLATVCKVNIPLIGGTLEQLILSNITMLFEAERQFMTDWVGQRR
jgi:hypothetical protein